MNSRVEYLRRRRESLVAQAAVQRSEVSSIALHLQQRLWPVDMGFAIVQAMREHPLLSVASATLLLLPHEQTIALEPPTIHCLGIF